MNNSRTASFLFLTLLAASSLIMSCKSSTTAPAAATPSIMDSGSTFTWAEYNNGSYDTIVYTVFDTTGVKNPNTSNGNVVALRGVRSSNNTTSIMFWSYETDGDVSLYPNPSGDNTTWMTLPFGSHGNVTNTFNEGLPNPSHDTAIAVWNSAGSFPLGGQSYSTDSVTLVVTNAFTTPPATSIQAFHYSYLTSIGIIGIENADNGADDVLISYKFK